MPDIVVREDSPVYEAVKKMEDAPSRKFKGVYIPAFIWDHKTLSWLEKCLWAEIHALGTNAKPCTASNNYLAEVMGSTPASIGNMVSMLIRIGLVKKVSFDGRIRRILAVIPTNEL